MAGAYLYGWDATNKVWVKLTCDAAGKVILDPDSKYTDAKARAALDYEEGVWTPDLRFGGLKVGITYHANTKGTYTRIGNRVFINCRIVLTSKGSSVGQADIYGIPYDADALDNPALSVSFYNVAFANMMHSLLYINRIKLFESTEAGVRTELGNGDFSDDSQVMIGGNYVI